MKTLRSLVSAIVVKPLPLTEAAGFGTRRKDPLSRFLAISSYLSLSVLVGSIISCGSSTPVTPPVTPPPVTGATLPCDTDFDAGTPCVAAHSSTRALFAAYNGPLYRVQRASDNATLDIGLLKAGDYANIAPQDSFCAGTACTVIRIYDQTANHNDLTVAPGGGAAPKADVGVPANALPVMAGGHPVYGLLFSGGMGYRNNATTGVATKGEPEGMYMVTSGTNYNNSCCFDYGNAETNNKAGANGAMDAVNFGNECWFTPCSGAGPWVQADMENGLFQSDKGNSLNTSNTGLTMPFVTAMLKNDGQSKFAIRAGDATTGVLTTEYAGALPSAYMPMVQQGAVLLGIGGDNSNGTYGSFFEGVMTAGYPTDTAENAVQANIVSVGYDTKGTSQGTLTVGSEISIQLTSTGLTGYYLSHQAGVDVYGNPTQVIVPAPLSSSSPSSSLADATWIVRAGLADPKCFSFEARDRPGEYMRHYEYILYSQIWDGTAAHAGDATFCAVTGLTGSGTSFQSFNFPTKYIRQLEGATVPDSGATSGTATVPYGAYVADQSAGNSWDVAANYNQDATFLVVNPLKP